MYLYVLCVEHSSLLVYLEDLGFFRALPSPAPTGPQGLMVGIFFAMLLFPLFRFKVEQL